jgi:hypothetical protein
VEIRVRNPGRKSGSEIRVGNPGRKSGSEIRVGNPGRKSGSEIRVGNPGRKSGSEIQDRNPVQIRSRTEIRFVPDFRPGSEIRVIRVGNPGRKSNFKFGHQMITKARKKATFLSLRSIFKILKLNILILPGDFLESEHYWKWPLVGLF